MKKEKKKKKLTLRR
jgi:hypothetical protein